MSERLLKMYNTNRTEDGKSLLQKSLDSSSGKGEALISETLREIITNTITRLSPILSMVESIYDSQKVHQFNRILSLPRQGGAQGESAITPTRNATYDRDASVTMKVVKRKGAVTGFLQDASDGDLDALAAEMENHILAHVYDLDFYTLWGNGLANVFEYSGWDTFIKSYRITKSGGDQVPKNLKFLDGLLDNNKRRQGIMHRKALLMTPEMLSFVSRLEAQFRLNKELKSDMGEIMIPGGWVMETYRGVPIIESTACAPVKKMTAVTATAFTTGGTLPDDDYFFVVVPLTYEGEQAPLAEVTDAVSGGGGNGRVDLTFAEDSEALSYKVYFGLASGIGGLKLHKVVPADTYDSIGTITGRTVSITIDTVAPDSSAPVGMQNDVPLQFVGDIPSETVWLIDLDRFQGMGELAYTNKGGDRFKGLVTIKALAENDDNSPFLVKSYPAVVDAFEATSGVVRGVRTE